MAISLGGLMRGALPVLSERIAAKPEDTENRLNALGEVFSNLAPAYEQKVAAAQKENEKITQLAGMTGVPEDVAYDLLKKHDGDVLKAEADAAKLMKAYKDKPIPTIKVDSATDDKSTDTVSAVNITSDKKGKENIISNFSQLFKFHTQDEIIDIFAKQNNLSPDKVKSIIFNTFKLPSYAPTTTLATEAYGAIRDYKEPEPVDKLAGIKVNVDFLKGFLSSKSQMELLKNESDKTLISDIVRTYGNLVQKQAEVGVGNLKPEDLEMIQTMLEAVPTDFIQLPAPPQEKLDSGKLLEGYSTRVDDIKKLKQEELIFQNLTKNEALNVQNKITPLFGKIQTKINERQQEYVDSDEYKNDLFELDTLLSKLEGKTQIIPPELVASIYVSKTSDRVSSMLEDLRTNKDKYPNAEAAATALTNYEQFILNEQDKPVGKRNIARIKEIFNDISTNNIFERTKSTEEIKKIFKEDYSAIFDTATSLRNIALNPNNMDYYSANQLNQMKQFGTQFEQIIKDNFNDTEALDAAMTELSEDMFLISPTKPAVPIAKQFEYLDSLVTNFIGNRDKYNEEVRKQFPMLLKNLNEIKNMTDSEKQRTAFLNFENQTVDILRSMKPDLSEEMQSIKSMAETLTQNSINPEKAKFYRDKDIAKMKSFSTRFDIIAALPDSKEKDAQLVELQNDMVGINSVDEDLLKIENKIKLSSEGQDLSDAKITELALTVQGIQEADVQLIDGVMHHIVRPTDGSAIRLVPVARYNSFGEQLADNPKIGKSAQEGLISTLGHIAGISDLKSALDKNPNAFNIVGTFFMKATDIADFVGAEKVAAFFKGDEIQTTVAKRIEFVKTVKDQIFDDPRLSDQDLRLIIQYIAVLNDPSIGKSRAYAALHSLEQVMVNSVAKNLYLSRPGLVVAKGYDDSGNFLDTFEDTIAGRTFRALFARAHPNFKVPQTQAEYEALSDDEKNLFIDRGKYFADQAGTAVATIGALEGYIYRAGGNVSKGLEDYNKNYAYNVNNKGTLAPMNILKGSAGSALGGTKAYQTRLIKGLLETMKKENPDQVTKLEKRLGSNFGIG